MMERKIKTKLPTIIIAPPTSVSHQQAMERDTLSKAKLKTYADRHRRAKHRQLQVGDRVLVKQVKTTIKPPSIQTFALSRRSEAPRLQERGEGK